MMMVRRWRRHRRRIKTIIRTLHSNKSLPWTIIRRNLQMLLIFSTSYAYIAKPVSRVVSHESRTNSIPDPRGWEFRVIIPLLLPEVFPSQRGASCPLKIVLVIPARDPGFKVCRARTRSAWGDWIRVIGAHGIFSWWVSLLMRIWGQRRKWLERHAGCDGPIPEDFSLGCPKLLHNG